MGVDHHPSAAAVLSAAADVQHALNGLAAWLRRQPGMTTVKPSFYLVRKDLGLSVEWYVSGHHPASGFDLEYRLELGYRTGEWLITACACGAGRDPNGSERLLALPDRYAVTDREFVEELDAACRTLIDHRAKVFDLFRTGYVARRADGD
ncbi:hypothetical protein GCM10010168_38200 [Actinoplanes ianthinogenes]|uniref:Immunity protein 63 domain-containing protein n=1 Tax=Actinoplanes ianthinogenes TaxID=122358 RepID=A0ABM7M4U1_9ACTN|nr:hypothetical protein [Actinoplanes ianthinogenes]BCJ46657.1 hypothetical protein Aiant_73140 [Actinoplanes ianthinogenes]GGR16589.1 hypothetical protein GCM10010168_38200 [Actinoplanes ianthinogenes]